LLASFTGCKKNQKKVQGSLHLEECGVQKRVKYFEVKYGLGPQEFGQRPFLWGGHIIESEEGECDETRLKLAAGRRTEILDDKRRRM